MVGILVSFGMAHFQGWTVSFRECSWWLNHPSSEKYAQVKLDNFPKHGEKIKIFIWNHHLVIYFNQWTKSHQSLAFALKFRNFLPSKKHNKFLASQWKLQIKDRVEQVGLIPYAVLHLDESEEASFTLDNRISSCLSFNAGKVVRNSRFSPKHWP